jgi:ribosomal protein L7/L12
MANSTYEVSDNLRRLADMATDYFGDQKVSRALVTLQIAILTNHAKQLRESLPKRSRPLKLEDGLTVEEGNLLRSDLRNKIKVIKMVLDRCGRTNIQLAEAKKLVDDYIAKHELTHYDQPMKPWANESEHHYGPTA